MEKTRIPIPLEEDLVSIPPLALLAFAARCGKRMLYTDLDVLNDQEAIGDLSTVVLEADRLAAGAVMVLPDKKNLRPASWEFDFSDETVRDMYARLEANQLSVSDFDIRRLVQCIRSTLITAVHGEPKSVARPAARAALYSALYPNEICKDYLLLKTLSKEVRKSRSPFVSQTVFGPLWPEGEPSGWPVAGHDSLLGDTEYELSVSGPDGADPHVVRERTLKLLRLMDRYVRASGGKGVVLLEADTDERTPCQELAPAGSGA